MDYKFNEDKALEFIKEYIDKTYEQHYASGNIQATEFIFDSQHGAGYWYNGIGIRGFKVSGDTGDTIADSNFRYVVLGAKI